MLVESFQIYLNLLQSMINKFLLTHTLTKDLDSIFYFTHLMATIFDLLLITTSRIFTHCYVFLISYLILQ